MKSFWEWMNGSEEQLNEGHGHMGKFALYPCQYGNFCSLPPLYWTPLTSDALVYIADDYPMMKAYEQSPFDITKLKPYPYYDPDKKLPPGEVVAPKSYIDANKMSKKVWQNNPLPDDSVPFKKDPIPCLVKTKGKLGKNLWNARTTGEQTEKFGPCQNMFKMPRI